MSISGNYFPTYPMTYTVTSGNTTAGTFNYQSVYPSTYTVGVSYPYASSFKTTPFLDDEKRVKELIGKVLREELHRIIDPVKYMHSDRPSDGAPSDEVVSSPLVEAGSELSEEERKGWVKVWFHPDLIEKLLHDDYSLSMKDPSGKITELKIVNQFIYEDKD